MSRDDIIRMAREAWALEFIPDSDVSKLERFAALVAAAEREACAVICDTMSSSDFLPRQCSAAIRARGGPCQDQ